MTTIDPGDQLEKTFDSYELFRTVMRVVTNNPLGVFTTIKTGGVPRSRCMVAVPADQRFKQLYSLTGRHSRKLHDITHNPCVCWMFTGPGHEDVVTVTGRAAIAPDLHGIEMQWSALMQASRRYGMVVLANKEETDFVGLQTVVERVEIVSPRLGIFSPSEVPTFHLVSPCQGPGGSAPERPAERLAREESSTDRH